MEKIKLVDFHPATSKAANGDNPQGAATDALARAFVRAQRLDGGESAPEPLYVSITGIPLTDGIFVQESLIGLVKKVRAQHGIDVTPENLVITCTDAFHDTLIGSAWFYIKQELARRFFAEEPHIVVLNRKTVEIEEEASRQLRRSFTAFFARLFGVKKDEDPRFIYKKMLEIVER